MLSARHGASTIGLAVALACQPDNPAGGGPQGGGLAQECATPRATWIWCDDFESDRTGAYFEYAAANGRFVRVPGAGVDGSVGMRARWDSAGQVGAGALHLAFGRTPQAYFRPVDAGTTDYHELYWRLYLRREPGWTGGGADKLSRAFIFASPTTWAQAMVAHVWSGGPSTSAFLVLDPASGTDSAGTLQTTTYNDFANFRWLGAARGATPVFADSTSGRWFCIETHVRLNDAGMANGSFTLWVDGQLETQRTGLNWLGTFAAYGLNAVFIENYWNAGAPGPRQRDFDRFVVATAPIGC
jgi:hypothetical protein